MRYLITGGAGFIGSHLSDALLARGDQVVCIDNFNDYYDPARKRRNIARALTNPGYTLVEADFRDADAMDRIFAHYRPQRVAHIGAMAGPRPSMQNPALYEDVNVRGTLTVLEMAARYQVDGLVLASTSSVYGLSPTPWSEESPTDRPLSFYAATKKAAEVLAYTAHRRHGIPIRIVRFFTVYGPRGRPDMTPHLFVDAMVAGKAITLFNGGIGVYRDWTYIADIVAGSHCSARYGRCIRDIQSGAFESGAVDRFRAHPGRGHRIARQDCCTTTAGGRSAGDVCTDRQSDADARFSATHVA
jgi:UDP-glucuronate 4-epimerase